jgi:hypothetical protein
MSTLEFVALCLERSIEPAVALECEEIREALRSRLSIEAVAKLLDENF